jgi:hypothetical protein
VGIPKGFGGFGLGLGKGQVLIPPIGSVSGSVGIPKGFGDSGIGFPKIPPPPLGISRGSPILRETKYTQTIQNRKAA